MKINTFQFILSNHRGNDICDHSDYDLPAGAEVKEEA